MGLDTTDSSVRRKRAAALGGTRRNISVAYQVHTTVVATFSAEVSCPALAASGKGYHTRPAANHEEEARPKRIDR
ncbi:MAG: hypothetical protein HY655_04390 [Acidobacteria bacterium]|nr:hypothetical protein [Acidobacteriota bacterium]